MRQVLSLVETQTEPIKICRAVRYAGPISALGSQHVAAVPALYVAARGNDSGPVPMVAARGSPPPFLMMK